MRTQHFFLLLLYGAAAISIQRERPIPELPFDVHEAFKEFVHVYGLLDRNISLFSQEYQTLWDMPYVCFVRYIRATRARFAWGKLDNTTKHRLRFVYEVSQAVGGRERMRFQALRTRRIMSANITQQQWADQRRAAFVIAQYDREGKLVPESVGRHRLMQIDSILPIRGSIDDVFDPETFQFSTHRSARHGVGTIEDYLDPEFHLSGKGHDFDASWDPTVQVPRFDPHFSALEAPQLTLEPVGPRTRRAILNTGITADIPNDITTTPMLGKDGLDLSRNAVQDIKTRVNAHFLVGYDCERPQGVTPVSSLLKHECVPPEAEEIDMKPTLTYQILQRAKKRTLSGWVCRRQLSQQTFFCGNSDHSTPVPKHTFFNRKDTMKPYECNNLVSSGKYKPHEGMADFTISLDGETVIAYYKHGNTYAYDGNYGSQISCNGDTVRIDGIAVANIVQYNEEIITVRKEDIVEREDGSLVAFYDNVRLPCKLYKENCIAGSSTYVWDVPTTEYCGVYYVRNFQGNELTTPGVPEKVVASADGSKVRFILKSTEMVCNRQVHQTNYPDVYLMETTHPDGTKRQDLIKQKLPKGEARLSLFITNRDDTLFHSLRAEIRKEYQTVWADDCVQRFQHKKLEHFVTREFPSLYTYSLGGNNFLSTAGESTFKYTCAARLVQAIDSTRCYDALPVIVFKQGLLNETKERPTERDVDGHHYFIEPLTHRITRVATVVPCTSGFYARYRDILDRWFAVTPRLLKVDKPSEIVVKPNDPFEDSYEKSDFGPGKGIYSLEDIDSLQRYLEFPRVRSALTYKLAVQAGDMTPEGHVSPNVLFPSYTIPGGSWSTLVMGKLWGFIRSFGEIASTILGVYLITRFLWELFKMCASTYHLYHVHGCAPQLCFALCMDVFHSREYMRTNRGPDARRGARRANGSGWFSWPFPKFNKGAQSRAEPSEVPLNNVNAAPQPPPHYNNLAPGVEICDAMPPLDPLRGIRFHGLLHNRQAAENNAAATGSSDPRVIEGQNFTQ